MVVLAQLPTRRGPLLRLILPWWLRMLLHLAVMCMNSSARACVMMRGAVLCATGHMTWYLHRSHLAMPLRSGSIFAKSVGSSVGGLLAFGSSLLLTGWSLLRLSG